MGSGRVKRLSKGAFRLAVKKAKKRNANKGFCRACFKTVPKGSNMCRDRDCQLYGIEHPEIFDDEDDE